MIVVGGYYGGYYSPYWDPFWHPYPWGFYGATGPQWGYGDRDASVRVQVTPREAQVYVDGYYAGIVDDFDGTFQRLHVRRGEHEITLYLEGYRTVRQRIYLSDDTYKLRYTMERLPAGEVAEKPTVAAPPAGPPQQVPRAGAEPWPPPSRPEARPRPPYDERRDRGERAPAGALAIRVQPGDAEVYIDGERWQGPDTQDRLVVELSEGTHRVEVRKEGFDRFTANVQVRRGETSTLNVTLTRGGGAAEGF